MKKTVLFQAVKEVLHKAGRPISVSDIQVQLNEKGLSPNKTSLYRMLERMKEENLLKEVLLNSRTTFYEAKKRHHHHFTCGDCKSITCIEDNDLEKSIHTLEMSLRSQGMIVRDHQFLLSGQCKHCST